MTRYQPPWYRRLAFGALGLVAPGRARVARHEDRYANDEPYRQAWDSYLRLREYSHARTRGSQSPWFDMGARSADAEILADLERLRDRSRDAARNDAVAAGILRAFRDGVVGAGVELRSTVDGERGDGIDEVWRELRDDLFPSETGASWGTVQRILAARRFEDGDVLVKRARYPGRAALGFELVEGDRLGSPLDVHTHMADPTEGQTRAGVERDRYGRVRAYWVSKVHPGDTALPGVIYGRIPRVPTTSAVDYVRVPVEDAKLFANRLRPGQSRGVPLLHSCLQDTRELGLLVEAVLKQSQMAACLALFIESGDDLLEQIGRKRNYGYLTDQDIQPGMLFRLLPGEKAHTVTPGMRPPDVNALVLLIARRIGTAVGVSWQVVLSDFSESTYSSARVDQIEAAATWCVIRSELVDVLRWVRHHALLDAKLRGDPRLAGVSEDEIRACTAIPPGRPWVDPQKEAAGVEIKLRVGLTTLRDEAAAQGKDWEDLLRQRAAERKLADELGLVLGEPQPAAAPAPLEDDDEGAQRRSLRRVA